jgi:hypothetical protein
MSLPSARPGLHSAKLWSELLRTLWKFKFTSGQMHRIVGDRSWAAAPLSSALSLLKAGCNRRSVGRYRAIVPCFS